MLKPTTNEGGQLMIAERTSTKRRSETFQAVTRIHGGSPSNVMTTLSGLVDSLATKFSEKDFVKIISKSPKLWRRFSQRFTTKSLRNLKHQIKTCYVVFHDTTKGKGSLTT